MSVEDNRDNGPPESGTHLFSMPGVSSELEGFSKLIQGKDLRNGSFSQWLPFKRVSSLYFKRQGLKVILGGRDPHLMAESS